MTKYRLYIDESGTHAYGTSMKIDQRFLSLTGVIIDSETYTNVLQPKIREIKQLIALDQDELPTLHREEIVAKKGVFNRLTDDKLSDSFNLHVLRLFESLDYTLITVVLDKNAHLRRYGNAAYHPYHYCLSVMLERYASVLGEKNATGDVMAEARGKVEDRLLQGEYRRFYERGTAFRTTGFIQSTLSSKEIKLKPKGVDGLEFTDLLTLATKLDVLAGESELPGPIQSAFLKLVIRAIQPKYFRSGKRIKGYGKKLIK